MHSSRVLNLDDSMVFDATLPGMLCNLVDPLNCCMTPLDYSAWFVFKYAFRKRAEHSLVVVGKVLDADRYRMPEPRSLGWVHCIVCKWTVYNVSHTLNQLQKIVEGLPKGIELSSPSHAFYCRSERTGPRH